MPTPSTQPAQTLHYGGSINPVTGKLSPKPQPGSQVKKLQRLEMMCRMEKAGLPEAQMAAMLSVSVPRLRTIKKSVDYLRTRMKIFHGIIVDQSNELGLIKQQRREMLASMLPPALQAIGDVLLTQPKNLQDKKLQVQVALEVMDREGTFAKVSRTEVKPVDHFSFEEADKASDEIIAALSAIAVPKKEEVSSVVSSNQEFSKSHTLSEADSQKAVALLDAVGHLEGSSESLEGDPE